MEINSNSSDPQYHPDDFVAYGSSGVCQVISQESCSFDGEHEESYYKLQPVDGSHSVYYVPVERASERLRPLLTEDKIYHIIDEMAEKKK
ncbi:MAG: CarD family transcriptional regulator [Ruminococcus sp.]|nr:CarD family transcriptional regulator [Ruminococcus sp.]